MHRRIHIIFLIVLRKSEVILASLILIYMCVCTVHQFTFDENNTDQQDVINEYIRIRYLSRFSIALNKNKTFP